MILACASMNEACASPLRMGNVRRESDDMVGIYMVEQVRPSTRYRASE